MDPPREGISKKKKERPYRTTRRGGNLGSLRKGGILSEKRNSRYNAGRKVRITVHEITSRGTSIEKEGVNYQ